MTYADWRGAVRDIQKKTGAVTDKQRELALLAGIEVPDTLPELVAAARLQNAFAELLHLEPAAPCSDEQRALIEQLSAAHGVSCSTGDRREASAWIMFLRLCGRQQALERTQLESGDVVDILDSDEEIAEVSSIGSDGRIYFKGGMGQGAWPDRICVIGRKADEGEMARSARRRAANERAARARTGYWSLAKQSELREFQVEQRLSVDDVEHLESTLATANDEKPIQYLIESHPQLLTSLVGGERRFCIPQVKLGAEFIPDFLIGAVDSSGIRWTLVELETPRSSITLQESNQLDKFARKGVAQIEEWREWLIHNLDYARRSRRDHGLGLADIRPASGGLVMIGRRSRLRANADVVRNPIYERNAIRIHTYDWWLDQLRGNLRYHGPWASNPYIIHGEDDESPSE